MVPAVFASSDIWGKGPLLFHRHALSKVPGLINIAALSLIHISEPTTMI